MRLPFRKTANSSAMGFTDNQLTEETWFLGCHPFLTSENCRKKMCAL